MPDFPGVQVWTKDHDILLCREVLSVNPLSAKKIQMIEENCGRKLAPT